jgi:hypothetical protein
VGNEAIVGVRSIGKPLSEFKKSKFKELREDSKLSCGEEENTG